VNQLTEFFDQRLEKKRFSAAECLGWPPAAEERDDRFQIVVIGMETHVCVLQTVLDLLALGYQTYVVVDALEYEPTRSAGRFNVHFEGVIDMAAAVGRGRDDFAGEGEFPGDRNGVISCGGGHHQAQREGG
jgi:hypothetical protein